MCALDELWVDVQKYLSHLALCRRLVTLNGPTSIGCSVFIELIIKLTA